MWKGRKAAFAAMGRISPNYIVQDGVIPRTALPRVLSEIDRMATAVNLRVANVFHAGDGNLHPLVLYDRAIQGQEEMALDLSYRILHLCVDSGGSITGEHGVGKEKQEALGYMFSEPDLQTMQLVRCAFDPREHFESRTRCFRGHGCARRFPAPTSRTRLKRPALRRSSDEHDGCDHDGRMPDSAGFDRRSRNTRISRRNHCLLLRAMHKQIAEVLRFANANGIAVTPSGSGTKLGWGNPVAAGIRLELKRMNTLREHPGRT